MLVLVKSKVVTPAWEKTWNSRINVWLRSPGLMLCSYMGIEACRHGPAGTACANHPVLTAILAPLVFVNGQYYMQRVTGNTYRKVERFSS